MLLKEKLSCCPDRTAWFACMVCVLLWVPPSCQDDQHYLYANGVLRPQLLLSPQIGTSRRNMRDFFCYHATGYLKCNEMFGVRS